MSARRPPGIRGSRRSSLVARGIGLAGALAVASLGAGCERSAAPGGLLLITIDTCRADRIGAYGARQARTPAIDGLAADGTLFEQATAPVPLTLPSHSTILTGLYPDRHGIRDNGAARLPAEAVTLSEILAGEGWRTAAFVSAYPLASEFGLGQGFEHYDEELGESAAGVGDALPDDAERMTERLFYDERLAAATGKPARQWIEARVAEKVPFFAWVHFFDPHASYRPPAHVMGPGMDPYDGEVAFVDEQIGLLLESLGDARSRVTVVVTADHGESLGQHEEASHGLFVYQTTLHVPWVMAGPTVPAGVRVADPVALADVLPTTLGALGVPGPVGIDGASRLELAAGTGEAPVSVYGESLFPRLHFDWAALRSIRRGRWKLIEAPRPELYDLATDPHETTNVYEAHPELVDELRAELRLFSDRGGALGTEEIRLDEAARERLDRLGYVGSTGGGVDDDLWNVEGEDPKDMVDFFNRLQELPTMLMEGRWDEGERLLLELRAEDPGNGNVVEKLALLERSRERWEAAIGWCEELIAMRPDDPQPRMNLAFASRRLERTDAARSAYQDVIRLDPDLANAWILLGSLESDAGRYDEAVAALARGAELSPDDPEVRAALGKAREDSGDPEGALVEFDRALALDPHAPGAVNGKALTLSHLGRAREAVELLRAALPHLGEDLDTLNNLAWVLANERIDAGEALGHARAALALAPDDPVVLDTFGWSAIRAGRPADAVDPLRRALELTGDAEVRAHLGIALAETGQDVEGRALVRAAVAERASLARIPEVAKWR